MRTEPSDQPFPSGWVVFAVDAGKRLRVLSVGDRLMAATTWRRLGLLRQRVVLPRVEQAVASGRPVDEVVLLPRGRDRARVIVDPVFGPGGEIHGVTAWLGGWDAAPEPRPRVNSWVWFALDRHLELGRYELRDGSTDPTQTRFSPAEYLRPIHMDDRGRVPEMWVAALAAGGEYELATVRAWRDDRLLTIRLSSRRVDDGGVVRLLGMSEDITAMDPMSAVTPDQQAAVALTGSSQLASGLALVLDEPMAVIDSGHRQVLSWLREPRLLADPADGMIVDSAHPDDRGRLADLIDESAATSQRMQGRFRLQARGGDWLEVEVTAASCGTDSEGRPRVLARLSLGS